MNKTKEFFNWKPKKNLKQGLKESIEWFKNNLERYSNETS